MLSVVVCDLNLQLYKLNWILYINLFTVIVKQYQKNLEAKKIPQNTLR